MRIFSGTCFRVCVIARAFNCDPISAFGGIVSFNRKITSKVAKELIKNFLEVVIAPEITIKAIEIFKNKPNLKILETGYQKRKEDNKKSLLIKSPFQKKVVQPKTT